jgi:hypothetical protein
MTTRERKDIPAIIAAFAVVMIVICAGVFGSFRLGAERFGTVSQSSAGSHKE